MNSPNRPIRGSRTAIRLASIVATVAVVCAGTTVLVAPTPAGSAAPKFSSSHVRPVRHANVKGPSAIRAAEQETRSSSKAAPHFGSTQAHAVLLAARNPDGTYYETVGGNANTWTNYSNAGGNQGPTIPAFNTVEIACVVQGFRVADGNTNWYQIAQAPWSWNYYVSADAFYNNGATSGSLHGTPFVDPSVPACGTTGNVETAGGAANTWTGYSNAGGSQGPTIGGGQSVRMACKVQGFKVQDGNTWWYRIQDQPWNNQYYVSADAFYNNGQTSGSLLGTPFVDPSIPDCATGSTGGGAPGTNETAGGAANTWSDYTSAGGSQGQTIGGGQTVAIACKIQGFRVADGNTFWYRIASAPWNGGYYVSADAFYNNGQTSGSLRGTPFYDPAVPDCTASNPSAPNPSTTPPGGVNETAGGVTHTWTNYTNAGGTQGSDVGNGQTVLIACKLSGFRVTDGNTWWYQIASNPWNGNYFASADAFYNNGHTSGSLLGTPYVDYNVPDCSTASGTGSSPTTGHPSGETAGGISDTFGNYSHAGAPGPNRVPNGATIQVTCRAQGFRVADGNTWWYLIATSPWNNVYYVSADAFYNNGATSGSLVGTPFYDPSVPICVNNAEAPLYSSSYGSGHSTANRTSCPAADPVDCASGNFSHSFTDASIPGRGPGIDLTRTYNSLNPTTGGLFGVGWSSTYDQSLNTGSSTRAADGSIVINLEDGSQVTATPTGTGFATPAQTDTSFVANTDGTYKLTRHEKLIEKFSAGGALISISDLNGNTTTLNRDSSQHLTGIVDASGRTLSVTLGANGLVAGVTDPMGRTTSYGYDVSNRLVTTTDPMGRTWTFTYDGNNRMLTMQDPRGGVVTNSYQSDGRVTNQVDAAHLATSFAYTGDNFSSLGGTTTITDPHGNVRVEQYANGFLTQAIKAPGTSAQATWTYQYDPVTYGQTQVTDPKGHITQSTFDGHGRLLTSTDPLGGVTRYTYNSLEEVTSIKTPLLETTSTTYDSSGNKLTETDPLGKTTTYTYGNPTHPGDLTAVTDPDGRVAQYTYDSNGDVSSQTSTSSPGVTETSTMVYDAAGELVCQTSPNATAKGISCPAAGSTRVQGTTTWTYDADREPTTTTDGNGGTTTTAYDANGNVTSVTNPDGNVVTSSYDGDNRKLTVVNGSGGTSPSTTTYGYDLVPGTGACTAVTGATFCQTIMDGNGAVTVDYFDVRGNLIEGQRPAGLVTTYTYDLKDNKATQTDAAGRTTTYGYDADDRLTSVSYSNGATPGVAYTYDADGHRSSMTDGTGTTHYAYDADGRTSSVTDGSGSNVTYGRDGAGDVTSIKYPNGQTVTRTFDGAGRLTSVADWLGHTTNYSYDADGNPTSTGYPNGDTTTSSYDNADALSATSVSTGTNTLLSLAYSRDPAGQITSEVRSGASVGTLTYAYNSNNQLVQAGGSSYAYDSAGNLTGNGPASQSYNAADELTSSTSPATTTAYGYDAVGDLTSAVQPTGAGTAYAYNQAGRMTSASQLVAPLQISSISPNTGSINGGTLVTITGSGFTGATSVAFGGAGATTFSVVSDSQITATAPAEASGTVDVSVTTPSGTTAAGASDHFTYIVPTIAAVAPNTGATAGGTAVTITGMNFTGASQVTFGGTPASSFTVNSDTQISATAPAHVAGPVDVSVTAPYGTTATGPSDQYTYIVPIISGVAPNVGPTVGGTTVTITGTKFTGTTQVTFGGTPASSFTVNSDAQITAITPAHAAGTVDIGVTTAFGTTGTGAIDQFTFIVPTISGVTPSSGPTAGGTTVTINGANFTGASQVKFGSLPASSFTVVSDTQITATAPPEASGAVDISVTAPYGTTATGPSDQYTYIVPIISGVAPNVGPTVGGTTVTITGTKFTGTTQVTFGGTPASSFTVNSSTQITAVAPPHAAGTVDIGVTTSFGTTGTGAIDQYTFIVPTISGVTPSSGPTAGGTTVTINGANFTGASQVKFGTLPASSFTVVSDTQITATAPPEASGAVDVSVTAPYGTTAAVPTDQYKYIVPIISGVAPNVGPTVGGTMVTITGTNLTGVSQVVFGTELATSFTVVSNNQITAVAPAHAAGAVDITVTGLNGSSATGASDQFTFGLLATIISVKPASGVVAGGKKVTIVGTNFTSATVIKFGTTPAGSIKVISATKLAVVAPAHAAGPVNITASNSFGSSPTGGFSVFTYTAVPAISSLSPNAGPLAGGTSVTISGSGFTFATQVTFGGSAATSFVVVSDSQITATSPAHAASTVPIVVTGPGGHNKSTSTSKFTYSATASAFGGSATHSANGPIRSQASATSKQIATYSYNGDGLRMTETTTTGSLAFVWDPTTKVPQAISDGSHFFIYGADGLPLEQLDSSNTPSYFFHDGLGSTRALLTSAGTIGASFTFLPYGTVNKTGALSSPIMFAVSYTDPATGLDYNVNRYYSPTTGQFTSVDAALQQTQLPYAYANDNPTNMIDPSGLISLRSIWNRIQTPVHAFVVQASSKVIQRLDAVYTYGTDAYNLYQSCGVWYSYECGIAIQHAGVDTSVGLVSMLCGAALWAAPACAAAVAEGGSWLLDKYGIKLPQSSSPSSPDPSPGPAEPPRGSSPSSGGAVAGPARRC